MKFIQNMAVLCLWLSPGLMVAMDQAAFTASPIISKKRSLSVEEDTPPVSPIFKKRSFTLDENITDLQSIRSKIETRAQEKTDLAFTRDMLVIDRRLENLESTLIHPGLLKAINTAQTPFTPEIRNNIVVLYGEQFPRLNSIMDNTAAFPLCTQAKITKILESKIKKCDLPETLKQQLEDEMLIPEYCARLAQNAAQKFMTYHSKPV